MWEAPQNLNFYVRTLSQSHLALLYRREGGINYLICQLLLSLSRIYFTNLVLKMLCENQNQRLVFKKNKNHPTLVKTLKNMDKSFNKKQEFATLRKGEYLVIFNLISCQCFF
jgi:hypothetical protein